jgi:hypothetical protein
LYELLVLSVGEKDIGAIDGKRVFKPCEILFVVFVFHGKIGGDASQWGDTSQWGYNLSQGGYNLSQGGHNLSQWGQRRISHCLYNMYIFYTIFLNHSKNQPQA